jgi:hypothetical protein
MRQLFKRVFTAGIVAALSPLLLAPALAEIKRFAFDGIVVFATAGGGSVTNGTPFSGYYTFDTGTADSASDPTVGDYWSTNSACGVVVKMGSYVFRTDPLHVSFLVEIVNRPEGDNYLLRSYQNLGSQGVTVDHISWQLDNVAGNALSTDRLPLTPPVLSAFKSDFGLTIEGGCNSLFIRGNVTSIRAEAVPPPPTGPPLQIQRAVEVRFPPHWAISIKYSVPGMDGLGQMLGCQNLAMGQ